jgi:hypothetical protein
MTNIIQEQYIITYSNYFKIGNETFAFRKKKLFNITNIPIYKPIQLNGSTYGYWINRQWYSLKSLKEIIIKESKEVDISNLQWCIQINLDECFNLEKVAFVV